tara:strand:- start:3499 stop:4140 length:642 start_codon:yes stop_codon:yes gene_type:complete
MDDHAGVSVSEPAVQGVQFVVSSVHWTSGWWAVGVGRMDANQRRQSAWFWHTLSVVFANASKSNIAVGQHPFMLSVKQDLEQSKISFQQGGRFSRFHFQQIAVHVSYQDLCGVQNNVPLPRSQPTFFGQLPCFLASLIALHGAGVLLNEQFLEQISHRSTDVGRVLSTCLGDTRARHRWWDHVPVCPFIVGEKMKEDSVFGSDIDLGYVSRHG